MSIQKAAHLYILKGNLAFTVFMSVGALFWRILGGIVANKLLDEGWKPTAIEAKECGLVEEVVQHGNLISSAQVNIITGK